MNRLALTLALVAIPALAHDFQDKLTDSVIELERVADMVRNDQRCGRTVGPGVQNLLLTYDQLWRGPSEERVEQSRLALGGVLGSAQVAGCNKDVSKFLNRALQSLTEAKGQVRSFNDDKRRRLDGPRRDDNDDDRDEGSTLAEVSVRTDVLAAGVPVVSFTIGRLTVRGRKSLAVRVQPEGGNWSEWLAVTPIDDDRRGAQTLTVPHSQLRGLGGTGRYQAQVAILSRKGDIKADSLVVFALTALPIPPPAPVPPPVVARDCGTGDDPGCAMNRGGIWAMDRETFQGMMVSLKANHSEFARADMATDIIKSSGVTAKQLGQVMDLFNSEFTKMDLVKKIVGRLVNPSHALALSVKFNSSFNQAEFTKLMTQQR